MDAQELRALQAPLKETYKHAPEKAVITLRAHGTTDAEKLACNLETGRVLAAAGLHPSAGGSGVELCSGDMLLEALVACAGVTLKAVATTMGISLRRGAITAEGELDVRGTLGIDKTAPVGFRAIRLMFEIDTDVGQDQVEQLVKLTERYCVVFQTLNTKPMLEVSTRRAG